MSGAGDGINAALIIISPPMQRCQIADSWTATPGSKPSPAIDSRAVAAYPWTCLDLLGLAWTCLDLLGLAWTCLDLLGLAWYGPVGVGSNAMSLQENLESRVIKIIRRDLMLGDEVALTPNQLLFGGDLDLDSLDALLLIQSLEVEFGFKMPNDSFGPEVFKSVATLARFVEESLATR